MRSESTSRFIMALAIKLETPGWFEGMIADAEKFCEEI